MNTFETISDIRSFSVQAKQQNKTVGFVPTMGNLHEGHMALVETAKQHADTIIMSIFVNPSQFGVNEDFATYPRTITDDLEKCRAAGVDAVFLPTDSVIYPDGHQKQTTVSVGDIKTELCGHFRPHFFDGVTTVVNKLFNITLPDIAVFGEKDFQQLHCIKKMVHDLNLPVTIYSTPTIRADDGLALSSRNQYLSSSERTLATKLSTALHTAKEAIQNGTSDFAALEARHCQQLEKLGFKPDYFSIRDKHTLLPANASSRDIVILLAAYLGQARLIDNLYFERKLCS